MNLPYEIIRKVAEHEGIPVTMMLKNDRHRRCKDARQKAMYFLRKLTNASLTDIGRNFEGMAGTKDHSTVLHAIKNVNNYMDTDPVYAESMEILFEILGMKDNRNEEKQIEYLGHYNSIAETSMPKLKLQAQKQAKQEVLQDSDRIPSPYYLEALKRSKSSYIKAFGEINI